MRLVTYLSEKNQERIALHVGEMGTGTLIDIARGYEALQINGAPADMLTLIRDFDRHRSHLKKLVDAKPASATLPEAGARLISPVPRPTSMRDGYAFRQHVEAARRNRGVPM